MVDVVVEQRGTYESAPTVTLVASSGCSGVQLRAFLNGLQRIDLEPSARPTGLTSTPTLSLTTPVPSVDSFEAAVMTTAATGELSQGELGFRLLTHLLAHSLTSLPTYLLAHLRTYSPTYKASLDSVLSRSARLAAPRVLAIRWPSPP